VLLAEVLRLVLGRGRCCQWLPCNSIKEHLHAVWLGVKNHEAMLQLLCGKVMHYLVHAICHEISNALRDWG
jgi:hypothetical protein